MKKIHDDSGIDGSYCGAILSWKGVCPKCGYIPDMQSIAIIRPLSKTKP